MWRGVPNQYSTGCWCGGWFPTNIQLVGWVGGEGGTQPVSNWLLVWLVGRGYFTRIQLVAGLVDGGGYPINIQLVAGRIGGTLPVSNMLLVGWMWGTLPISNWLLIGVGVEEVPYQYLTGC